MTARAPSIVAVVGPSGAGKDTLIDAACAADPRLYRARRVITRPEAAGGEAFDGIPAAEFATRLAAGEFAVHWDAHGLSYAIPRAEFAHDGTVIFNGSRAALSQAAAVFPGLQVILVTAPVTVLAHRLAARGRETETDIAARLARSGFALPAGIWATEVMNDSTPEEGLARFLAAFQPDRAAR